MPSSLYPLANSAPVTPDPTTTRCRGSSARSYTSRHDRIRSPSGTAVGSVRGVPPVAISATSASTVSMTEPSPSTASTRWARPGWSAANRPDPAITWTPSAASRCAMSSDCCRASALIRPLTAPKSTDTAPSVPSPTRGASRRAVTRSLVAMRVLLGTQSVSTHDPPSPSRSITVTCAPSWAATRADS